jgi:predicted adenylyl cyclase CyaB
MDPDAMQHLNIEIKARCDDLGIIRAALRAQNADFIGEDRQIDTYFRVPEGRLKLREGTIERSLIHYHRPNQDGPKPSKVTRYEPEAPRGLKHVLTAALGIWVVVAKTREIYFIDNVKFHLDRVDELGTFVEIEAIGRDETDDPDALRTQCETYMDQFDLAADALVADSYSDLLHRRQAQDSG